MRGTSATGRRVAGFTLLELLVVMAIVTLLAAALPAALNRSLPGRRVAVTTDRLVAGVRDAQAASVLSGQPVTLELQSRGFAFSHRAARAGSFAASTRVVLTDTEGRPAREITVFPDGSAQGGRFEIVDGPHRRTVIVSPLTGRVFVDRTRGTR